MLARDEACPLPLHERRQCLADVLDAYAQLGVPYEYAVPMELLCQTFIESKDHP